MKSAAIALAVVIASVSPLTAAENLLRNGVLGAPGKDGVPEAWERRDRATRCALDRRHKPEGLPSSLRITVVKPREKLNTQFAQRVIGFRKKTVHILSGYLKGQVGGDAYVQIKLHRRDGNRERTIRRLGAVRFPAEWRPFEYAFNTSEADSLTVLARIVVSPRILGKSIWLAGLALREKKLNLIDLTEQRGETPGLMKALTDRLPKPDRKDRFRVTTEDGRPVLRIRNFGEGQRLVLAQPFRVTPGVAYRMMLESRGLGQFEIEWQEKQGVARLRGDVWRQRQLSFRTRPDEGWRKYECLIPPCKGDRLWLNVYVRYATVWGPCRLRGLRLVPTSPPRADRPIELTPGGRAVVRKIPEVECRALRAFMGGPADGTVRSRHYGYSVLEYGDGYAGQAVYYNYNAFDGMHIHLPPATAFNYVALRGGCYTRMYRDAKHYDRAEGATRLWEFVKRPLAFKGHWRTNRRYELFPQSAWFDRPVRTNRVSFFDTFGGCMADLGFYHVERASAPPAAGEAWALTERPVSLPKPRDVYDVRNIRAALAQRADAKDDRLLTLASGEAPPAAIRMEKGRRARFFTAPFPREKAIGSLTLDFALAQAPGPVKLMTLVHDPLDPRRDLHCAAFLLKGEGRYRVNLDFVDQIVFKGRRFWITLLTDTDCALRSPKAVPHRVSRETALPETVAWRKFIMKCLYLRLSEPRSWMRWKGGWSRERVFKHYGPLGGRYLAELFATLDDCHALAPKEDEIRQYREWCYSGSLKDRITPPPPPRPAPGAPAWAHYARLGWIEMRAIAERWFRRRQVPTGEFGGRVNDDSCFYQQVVDLAYLQDDGIVPYMKECAKRFRKLTLHKTIRYGVDYNDMDSLHAYEEGMNHLALMTRWFYGDPLYIETLMESTRSVTKFTILTEDGRRHFRNDKQGIGDITHPRPLGPDTGRRALTMHTVLQLADYNRSPLALKLASEWADTWNRFQKPGRYATSVDVKTGKVLEFRKTEPLTGYSQADAHLWLSDMTGDLRFVKPLRDICRGGELPGRLQAYVIGLHNLGALDDFPAKAMKALAEKSAVLRGYVEGDPDAVAVLPIMGSAQGSWGRFLSTLYSVQRWPNMMDPGKQYTDRVWFAMLANVARVYLGGFSKRNSYYPGQAVSWEGFGDDYAAAVMVNRRDRLRVLVYNFRKTPMSGAMRVWRLRHGVYRVRVGPDANRDGKMDRATSTRKLELYKAERVPLTLPARAVTVIEATPVKGLPSIFTRPDLAIVTRETSYSNGRISGVLHNIGAAPAKDVKVVVQDAQGRTLGSVVLASIDAPLDLMPRRAAFAIPVRGRPAKSWRVVVDPGNAIPEIYEGNNRADLPM